MILKKPKIENNLLLLDSSDYKRYLEAKVIFLLFLVSLLNFDESWITSLYIVQVHGFYY